MLPSHADRTHLPQLTSGTRHHHSGAEPHPRRWFLGRAAGAAGAGIAASLLPGVASAGTRTALPRPIPGGLTFGDVTFHVNGFGLDADPITITDFNGAVGVCDVQGTGTATNPDGSTETLLFDTDMRFMQGEFIGRDDRHHRGTFGFV